MRVGGQVIWASRFKEKSSEGSSGKGGPNYVNYTYSVSVAVALCQGAVKRLDRVWENSEQVALSDFSWRLYRGDETQLPDPLIETIEGSIAMQAAIPELQIVDGPVRAVDASSGLVATIAADPWGSAVSVRTGPSVTNLREPASARFSAKIGNLLSDLPSGPLGRWDEANQLHI